MARFLQWSDLHREFRSEGFEVPFPLPNSDCPAGSVDAILIAGDLDHADRHVQSLLEIEDAWSVPVISIAGNHEYYGSSFKSANATIMGDIAYARKAGHQVDFLYRAETIIGDTRILGCTLWSDFEIYGQADNMMIGAELIMNDYNRIGIEDRDGERRLRARDTAALHKMDRAWLLDALSKSFHGKTLVMTHHLPAPETLACEAYKEEVAPAYVSDLRNDILDKNVDVWISGHTHWARRGLIQGKAGPIAFTANMAGYNQRGTQQRTNFDPYRVIDTNAPAAGLEPLDIEIPELDHLPSSADVLREIDRGGDFEP